MAALMKQWSGLEQKRVFHIPHYSPFGSFNRKFIFVRQAYLDLVSTIWKEMTGRHYLDLKSQPIFVVQD